MDARDLNMLSLLNELDKTLRIGTLKRSRQRGKKVGTTSEESGDARL